MPRNEAFLLFRVHGEEISFCVEDTEEIERLSEGKFSIRLEIILTEGISPRKAISQSERRDDIFICSRFIEPFFLSREDCLYSEDFDEKIGELDARNGIILSPVRYRIFE